MLSVSNITVSFGDEYLFKDVSFNINKKDKIGLIGRNGAGKSTLLKIIAGEVSYTSGSINYPSSFTIGYLPQETILLNNNNSVIDEVLSSLGDIIEIEKRLDEIERTLKDKEFEISLCAKLMDEYNDLNIKYNMLGGRSIVGDVEKVLKGLGFDENDMKKPVNTFSGGWNIKIKLAKILLKKYDLILLDEPTNYLDIESIRWLEDYLVNFSDAIVVISHDKMFLNNVTNRTIEISNKKIYDYNGNYSSYKKQRELLYEQQLAEYNNQQKKIEQLQKFIDRFRYKPTKAAQVQSKIKLLEKMDDIKIEEIETNSIYFTFPPSKNSGKIVLEVKNLSKNYGDKEVLNNVNMVIKSGDKVAFVGKNGMGKSTLIKIIAGKLEYDGICKLGYNVDMGYYAQNEGELLNKEITVLETLESAASEENIGKIRSILGSFLFQDDDVYKKVSVLSEGEKSRLALAKLLLKPSNLLILDEPTNHLDIMSKDILKQALSIYDKTLILVSHDRDFLQGLVNKVYEFKNREVKEFLGDIDEFLAKRKIDNLYELEYTNRMTDKVSKKDSYNKFIWQKRKEIERELNRIRNKVNIIEEKIQKNNNRLNELSIILANSEIFNNIKEYEEKIKEYEKIKEENKKFDNEWLELNINIENYEKEYNNLLKTLKDEKT